MNTLLTYIRPCVLSVLRQGRHSFLIGMEMLCFFVCDGAPSLLFLQIVSNSTSRKRRQTSAGDGNRFLLSITGFQSSIDRKERVHKNDNCSLVARAALFWGSETMSTEKATTDSRCRFFFLPWRARFKSSRVYRTVIGRHKEGGNKCRETK